MARKVELPGSLRILGNGAFSFCSHIEELIIPDELKGRVKVIREL